MAEKSHIDRFIWFVVIQILLIKYSTYKFRALKLYLRVL